MLEHFLKALDIIKLINLMASRKVQTTITSDN